MSYESQTRSQIIFDTLRDRIIYGAYPPGSTLPEKDLCREFEVSRTPLREAILRLKEIKLLTLIPRYGTLVTPIDLKEIRSAFEVKIRLEGLVGQLAAARISSEQLDLLNTLINEGSDLSEENIAPRHRKLIEIDGRFHEILYDAAQNAILEEFLKNLHSRCARLWNSSLSQCVPTKEIVQQFKEVYTALREGDCKKAAQHMELHVQYFIDKIKTLLL
jgi:GntR family transcriptional regulator, rspAB operon transcriptional repressor